MCIRDRAYAEFRETRGEFLCFFLVWKRIAARGEVLQHRFERRRNARLRRAIALGSGGLFRRRGRRACRAHQEHEEQRAKAHESLCGQKVNFSTSSTMRGAENVFWILPNVVGSAMFAEPIPSAKFGWFSTLNASIRTVA